MIRSSSRNSSNGSNFGGIECVSNPAKDECKEGACNGNQGHDPSDLFWMSYCIHFDDEEKNGSICNFVEETVAAIDKCCVICIVADDVRYQSSRCVQHVYQTDAVQAC